MLKPALGGAARDRRSVNRGCHHPNPGLIGMLRAEIRQHRVGELVLQQFRGPIFHCPKLLFQRFRVIP
jgi:hypothetical protein